MSSKKDFPLEFSDRIRRLNIRHEALLIKTIERIEKERKIQRDRLELSIKAAEEKANSSQNRFVFTRLKNTKRDSVYVDDLTDGSSLDGNVMTFLDRQIEGYRKTLHLLSCRSKKDDLTLLTDDKIAEPTFDAHFPSLNKAAKKGIRTTGKTDQSKSIPKKVEKS